MIKIIVNELPPSNNRYMGNSNSYFSYGKDKKRWFNLIKNSLEPKDKPPEPIKLAEVTLIYYFADNRRRDPDNYSGKFILDALVGLKILEDDNFDVVDTLKVKGFRKSENPRVEIIINPLEKSLKLE